MSADAENGAAKEVPCDDSSREAGICKMPASVSKTILVVGLGMVGIGEHGFWDDVLLFISFSLSVYRENSQPR